MTDYGVLAAAVAWHVDEVMDVPGYADLHHRAAALMHLRIRVPALESRNELFGAVTAAAYLTASGATVTVTPKDAVAPRPPPGCVTDELTAAERHPAAHPTHQTRGRVRVTAADERRDPSWPGNHPRGWGLRLREETSSVRAIRLRWGWIEPVMPVPYVPTLGPHRSEELLPKLLEAVVATVGFRPVPRVRQGPPLVGHEG
ncbi:hypothetical protein [Streptomyces sp. NPDC059861]|uniref:hypothetical protein n=1 Tax=Streptomyces sp. NPDC059861 TaxID=3346974 RepID=UPI0036635561